MEDPEQTFHVKTLNELTEEVFPLERQMAVLNDRLSKIDRPPTRPEPTRWQMFVGTIRGWL